MCDLPLVLTVIRKASRVQHVCCFVSKPGRSENQHHKQCKDKPSLHNACPSCAPPAISRSSKLFYFETFKSCAQQTHIVIYTHVPLRIVLRATQHAKCSTHSGSNAVLKWVDDLGPKAALHHELQLCTANCGLALQSIFTCAFCGVFFCPSSLRISFYTALTH